MQNKDYGLLAEAKEEGVPVVLARRRLGGWGKGGGHLNSVRDPVGCHSCYTAVINMVLVKG